jgi:uncharacterized protein
MQMTSIREDILRDPRYPVHRIADKLLPYLQVLVDQFHPKKVILFGSYAYGTPDEHSDIDLLVVYDTHQSALKRRIEIRDAWWKMPREDRLLPFDLVVSTSDDHRNRLQNSNGFYNTIVEKGLPLV